MAAKSGCVQRFATLHTPSQRWSDGPRCPAFPFPASLMTSDPEIGSDPLIGPALARQGHEILTISIGSVFHLSCVFISAGSNNHSEDSMFPPIFFGGIVNCLDWFTRRM
ncbi:hypothetical protein E2C01_046425 [Portunus trituberculatus]|uniref:Uncharacterized protein n=1 Tax=Portunus trituberculatus TaxID=210409 RepID=A0A5B7G7Q3_PORTR|nr:hypothetical protein [Portunus trituberculatus]